MLHRNCKKKKKNQKENFLFFFFFLLAPTPQWTQILFTVTFTFLRSLQVLPKPCCCRIAGSWGLAAVGTSLGRSGAGRSLLAACRGSLPLW